MTATTTFDIEILKYEILNKIRANLSTYDPNTRVTETTTNFTAAGSQTVFTLNSQTMSYVKSVSVNAVVQAQYDVYNIVWENTNVGSVVFLSAVADGATVSIVWGNIAGNSNFIYPDWPLTTISLETMPRIGFKLLARSEFAGSASASGYGLKYDVLISFKCVAEDTALIDQLLMRVKTYITTHAKSFYGLNFVEFTSFDAYDNFSDKTKKAYEKVSEYVAKNKYEMITYA